MNRVRKTLAVETEVTGDAVVGKTTGAAETVETEAEVNAEEVVMNSQGFSLIWEKRVESVSAPSLT